MSLKNDLLIRVAKGEKTERTPVWLMRQAGRILPEYRAVRAKVSGFKELVETPDLASEVTVQPVDLLNVDAAIIFSDILVVPEAMGLSYKMTEKKGPFFPETIQSHADFKRLKVADPAELSYVYDAIKITKKELSDRVPLIGFSGAPWTIFAYMTEGSASKTFSKARRILYTDPNMAHALLDMITDTTIGYLKAQIEAGADIIQVFDSWAGVLPPEHYSEFSVKYLSTICNSIDEVPITVFAKGSWFALKEINTLNCDTIGLDWNINAKEAQKVVTNKALQGNLDPCALYGSFQEIKSETKKMLNQFDDHPHIANLGHGVYPDTDPDKVKCFVETVKELSSR